MLDKIDAELKDYHTERYAVTLARAKAVFDGENDGHRQRCTGLGAQMDNEILVDWIENGTPPPWAEYAPPRTDIPPVTSQDRGLYQFNGLSGLVANPGNLSRNVTPGWGVPLPEHPLSEDTIRLIRRLNNIIRPMIMQSIIAELSRPTLFERLGIRTGVDRTAQEFSVLIRTRTADGTAFERTREMGLTIPSTRTVRRIIDLEVQ